MTNKKKGNDDANITSDDASTETLNKIGGNPSEDNEQEEKEAENLMDGAQADFSPLLKRIKVLESELQKSKEIAKNSQVNYLHLKADFDLLQRQTQQKIDNVERDAIIKVVKDLLPFLENLRKSLLNLPEEQRSSQMAEGLTMVYNNFIKSLENLHIKPIEALGLNPDPQFHEPVSTQLVDDKKLKGKIIQEFQQGFIYQNNEDTIVITPSKVIVGN